MMIGLLCYEDAMRHCVSMHDEIFGCLLFPGLG